MPITGVGSGRAPLENFTLIRSSNRRLTVTNTKRRTTVARLPLIIGICIASASGCEGVRQPEIADTPPASVQAPAGSEVSPDDSIRAAALDYVRRETAVQDAQVTIQATAEGWARVTVAPADDQTDPATMYLQRTQDGWRGVTIGTAFAPDELDRHGVPAQVRPE